MVPSYDCLPVIDVDEKTLRRLTAYEVIFGMSVVRDYRPLIDVTWDEAQESAEAESRWLERAARAADAAGFDAVLVEAPEAEAGDDFDWLFRGNDVGAAGLVLALCAAGFATCYSCRGHADLTGAPVPQVRLGTEPERLQVLARLADQSNCGLETHDGLATVYARSVSDLHQLAQLLLDKRAVFDELPSPPWRVRAMEALDRGEDFEWDDDELI